MVNRAAEPDMMNDMSFFPNRPGKRMRNGRVAIEIRWPKPLFDAIEAEAQARGWSFSRMVRHLCEASIEGIE